MGLIHHVVMSVGDDFFKVVCQEFSANIESIMSGLDGMEWEGTVSLLTR